MGAKKFSHTNRSTMCGLKKLASGVFPGSQKVLAERLRRRQRRLRWWRWQRKRTKNNKSPSYPGWLNNQTKCHTPYLVCRTPFHSTTTEEYLLLPTCINFYMTCTWSFYIKNHINVWHTKGQCWPVLAMDRTIKINDCPTLQSPHLLYSTV